MTTDLCHQDYIRATSLALRYEADGRPATGLQLKRAMKDYLPDAPKTAWGHTVSKRHVYNLEADTVEVTEEDSRGNKRVRIELVM